MLKDGYEAKQLLEKIGDDEEVFLLRAQDVLAPMVIEYWAELAAKLKVGPQKILRAYDCANKMKHFPTRRLPD
jgi:hypothetical protein